MQQLDVLGRKVLISKWTVNGSCMTGRMYRMLLTRQFRGETCAQLMVKAQGLSCMIVLVDDSCPTCGLLHG